MVSGRAGRAGFVRRWAAGAVALLILAMGAACTSGGMGGADPAVQTVWTAGDLEPASAVRNVGGVAVVYSTTPDELSVHALDPATGAELWRQPAVPPVSVTHVWVAEVDDLVGYLRPTGTQRVSRLVIADPRSGADVTVSEQRYWASYPEVCADDAGWVCATSYVQAADGRWLQHPFRVERATGRTVPSGDAPENTPDGAFEIPVVDLFYSFPDDGTSTMTIGRAENGTPVWSAAATDVFGPGMPSPGYFWFDDPQGADRTMFTGIGRGDGGRLNLTTDIAAASVSLSDGTINWSAPGSWHGCAWQPALSVDRQAADGEPDAYLCRYTGFAEREGTAAPDSRLVTSDLSVTLQRIDSETGAVSWSRELGDAKPLAADATGGDTALLTDDKLFIPNSAGGVVLNLQTGDTEPPTVDDTFWCMDQQSFRLPEPFYDESTQISTADRIGVVHPCRADGQDAPIPTDVIPADIGETFEADRRVVALPDAVVGLTVRVQDDPATTTAETTAAAPTGSAPAVDQAVTAVEQIWAAGGFAAKTTPILVGGTAVLYGTVGTDLFLIGLDPATGAERWRRPASAAAIPPGVEVRVVELDGRVAYLRPGDPATPRLTQIALLDPGTGADMLVTESRWWYRLPAVCTDDPASWCAAANYVQLDNSVARSTFRIDRSTGATSPVPAETQQAPWTTLWDDLVQVTGAPTETVGMVTGDRLDWSAPLADLLGPGATLDHGWYAAQDTGRHDVLQLSTVVGWPGEGELHPALDLAEHLMTVGLDRRDGTVLWREPGTSPQCRWRLPSVRTMSTPGSLDPSLRCRYTGRLDSSPPGRDYGLTVPTDLTVILERVDLQTGKAVWSVPLGAESALAVIGNRPTTPLEDDHRILVGGLVVDLDDGSTRPPSAGEIFWCSGPRAFEQSVEWFGADGDIRIDRSAVGEVFTCDSKGDPAAGPPDAVPLAVSVVTDQELRLVATPTGVVAYRVPR